MIHDLDTLTQSPEILNADYTYGGAPLVPANSDPFAKHRKETSTITGFAENTMILTSNGLCPVQKIHAGMQLHTRDHGVLPVRWSGRTDRSATSDLQPIVIPQGALANDITLKVASHQGLLFTEWRAAMFFGEPEILVKAKGLVGMSGIHRQKGCRTRFYHLMLDQHALIHANGAWTESLHPEDLSSQRDAELDNDIAKLVAASPAFSSKTVPAVSVAEARVIQAA